MKKQITTTMVLLATLLCSGVSYAQNGLDQDLIIDADLSARQEGVNIYHGENYEMKTITTSRSEESQGVAITAKGERYRSSFLSQLLVFKKISDDLYIVERQAIHSTMPIPAPPRRTFEAMATQSVFNDEFGSVSVRVLVPAGIELTVDRIYRAQEHPRTCLAYFEGFVYQPETDSCQRRATSGCSNPYEFTALEQCESTNLLD